MRIFPSPGLLKSACARAALSTALLSACAAVLLLAGCTARFESFFFLTADGKRIEIRESPGRSREAETVFSPTRAHPSSPLYSLRAPLRASGQRLAFAFTYTSTLPHARLNIFSEKNKVLRTAALPETNGTPIRFLVPVAAGDTIWGYQLTDTADSADSKSLNLQGAGTAPLVHGFAISSDGLSVDGSVSVLEASADGAVARISAATQQEMLRGAWVIHMELDGGADAAGQPGAISFVGADGRSSTFTVDRSAGATTIDFARGSVPFLPRDIRARIPLKSLDISLLAPDVPIPADPGMILSWQRSAWRRPDFELYSWDRYPHVLIFDTASYDVQDGLFKRLAYFVEKAGFRNTIEDVSALEGKHGYNAHDYRAEDLARFFSTAAQRGLALSAEEKELQQILVTNDLIRPGTSGFSAGKGALISISRSSSDVLRQLLLTHECAHGVFFSLPAFREGTEAVWQGITPVEQEVWLDFLATRNYDTTDHYLVINEFQAYLFQQDRASVEPFQALTMARMKARGGQAAALARELLAGHPHSFLDSFDALDARLWEAGGAPGSRVLAVMRAEN